MKWKGEEGTIASRREYSGVSWRSGESVVDDRSRDVEASGPWAGAGEGGGPLGEVGGVSRARFLWTMLRNMGFISSYYRLTTLIHFCENRIVWTCLERHFFVNSGSLHCTSGAVLVLPGPRTCRVASCSPSSSPSSCTRLSLPATCQPSALAVCRFSCLGFSALFSFDTQGSAEIDRLW